ncbi:MAG: hypothetical protein ACLTSL_06625 [Odoribacter splanchnicus]
MKILYIRLDSSSLPEVNDEIIVKDFNMECYFCTFLGKALLEGHTMVQPLNTFPGKIVSDFKDSSVRNYNTIIKQWELILAKLLSANNKEKRFVLDIPVAYFEWLSHQEDKVYREIGHTQSCRLSFAREFLYEELIESVLLKRLEYTLRKINEAIDCIVIGLRYQQGFCEEKQLGNYIKSLNEYLKKSTVMHRKDFFNNYSVMKLVDELHEILSCNKNCGDIQ